MFSQIKEFFKPFPKPGSLAYKFWCWKYGVKPDKPPEVKTLKLNLFITDAAMKSLESLAPGVDEITVKMRSFEEAYKDPAFDDIKEVIRTTNDLEDKAILWGDPNGILSEEKKGDESTNYEDELLDIPTYIRRNMDVNPYRMDSTEDREPTE